MRAHLCRLHLFLLGCTPLPPCRFSFCRRIHFSTKICTQQEAPARTQKENETLTCGELHQPRRRRIYAKQDSKAALEMLFPAMDASETERARDTQ